MDATQSIREMPIRGTNQGDGPIRGTVLVMGHGTSGDWCRKHPHDVGTILLSRLVGWRGQLGKRPVMGVRPSSVLFWCLAPLSWAAYFK